jgi:tetratricopeptide (TPR) repeat protein
MAHAGESPPDLADFPLLREARSLWDGGRLEEALGAFRRAVDREPRNVKALLEAARALGARYEVAEAERLLDRADALAGDDPRVGAVYALSYRFLHRPGRGVEALEPLRSRPGGLAPDVLAELATLYEQAGRVREARDAIGECIDRAPGHPEPRLVLARLERRLGHTADAESILSELTGGGGPPALGGRAGGVWCELRDRGGG